MSQKNQSVSLFVRAEPGSPVQNDQQFYGNERDDNNRRQDNAAHTSGNAHGWDDDEPNDSNFSVQNSAPTDGWPSVEDSHTGYQQNATWSNQQNSSGYQGRNEFASSNGNWASNNQQTYQHTETGTWSSEQNAQHSSTAAADDGWGDEEDQNDQWFNNRGLGQSDGGFRSSGDGFPRGRGRTFQQPRDEWSGSTRSFGRGRRDNNGPSRSDEGNWRRRDNDSDGRRDFRSSGGPSRRIDVENAKLGKVIGSYPLLIQQMKACSCFDMQCAWN